MAISYHFPYRREALEHGSQDEKDVLLYREQSEHPHPFHQQVESDNADSAGAESQSSPSV